MISYDAFVTNLSITDTLGDLIHILVFIESALSGSASEFTENVLDHRHLGPQTHGFIPVSLLLKEKISSSACRTDFFSVLQKSVSDLT